MTIKERIAEIWAQIAEHETEIKKLKLDIEKVRLDCTHPNKVERVINYGNEYWRECADCGAEIR